MRMVFDASDYNTNSKNIKQIYNKQACRDIPDLTFPRTPGEGKNAKTYVGLLDAGTRPNDLNRISV